MRILIGMVVSTLVFMFGVWLSGQLNATTPYGMHFEPGALIDDGRVIEGSDTDAYRVYVLVPDPCCCDESTNMILPNRSEF